MTGTFIPCASLARSSDISEHIPEGSEIFFTAPEKELGALSEIFSKKGRVAGCAPSLSMTLEDLAPAVIDAAEKLGGISSMVFAPELSTGSTLFLDLPEQEFLDHLAALGGFFSLCKCALPYMMGQENAAVTLLLPREADNTASAAFSAAAKAVTEKLGEEFEPYGIKTEVIQTCLPPSAV